MAIALSRSVGMDGSAGAPLDALLRTVQTGRPVGGDGKNGPEAWPRRVKAGQPLTPAWTSEPGPGPRRLRTTAAATLPRGFNNGARADQLSVGPAASPTSCRFLDSPFDRLRTSRGR